MNSDLIIHGQDLNFSYGTRNNAIHVVKSANITCRYSQLTLLSGESGCGKSSLFFLLSGMAKPSSGTLDVLGYRFDKMNADERAKSRRHKIALIFQAYNLLPMLTAFENVAYPLRRSHIPNLADKTMDALKKMGIAHRAHCLPGVLSGGEQQRVALARAMVQEPSLLLADEPTGALDAVTGKVVMEIFREFAQKSDTAVVMISHDKSAEKYADKLLRMEDGVLYDA